MNLLIKKHNRAGFRCVNRPFFDSKKFLVYHEREKIFLEDFPELNGGGGGN